MISPLANLFAEWTGAPPEKISPILHASASHRQYYRLEGGGLSVIGTLYDNTVENEAFLYLSRHFKDKNLPVPEVFAVSPDRRAYLQEDLGGRSLYDELQAAHFAFSPSLRHRYAQVVDALAHFQIQGHEGLNYDQRLSIKGFDKQEMIWDLTYFKYYFLKILDVPFDEYALESEFQALGDWLQAAQYRYFMHRDFQSRNILLRDEKPFFIDYQGGRRGPLQYDLVSLLWQAKARIPNEDRQFLLQRYLETASRLAPIDHAEFSERYDGFVLLRGLQTLGAYGLRGLVEKKSHFLESIPFALHNVHWILQNSGFPFPLPELTRSIERLDYMPPAPAERPAASLTVLVQSFSYKKGIPADESGHGGGFVFDCRGIENPGRQDAFKSLTGQSPEVIAFLKGQTRMDAWLEHVFAAVSETVDNYLERQFDRLSVSFGCTGGQHRSVYAAERMADFLRKKYGVNVTLRHTRQDDWPL